MSVALLCALALLSATAAGPGWGAERRGPAGPQPGDIYREFAVRMEGPKDWRVTDPDCTQPGAQEFLPNPVLKLTLIDLEGAVRAEALLDRWGGHPGTTAKRIRFNGNAWIPVPELATTPRGHSASCYMAEDNPVVPVPLEHLKEGENTFEGTCGGQEECHSFNWGQWGWYGLTLRVYYGPEKPHPTGRITSPVTGEVLGEKPTVLVAVSGPAEVDRVDVLAWYEGYDENGDGVYKDWHGHTHYTDLAHHVGTATVPPFGMGWDTRWVPDQPKGSLKLVARVRDIRGIWSVTPPVEKLTLARQASLVKLHKPSRVPPAFWVRAGKTMGCQVELPRSYSPDTTVEAAVHVRTWNGAEESLTVNGHPIPIKGEDHNYAYTVCPVPVHVLKPGVNTIEFHSKTEHHGVEVLWPGPALVIRYIRQGR